jgi:8-oxo-dGTP pyrophosphatase MutT (NUDIX family)
MYVKTYVKDLGEHYFNDDTDDKVGVIITNFDHELLVVKGVSGKFSFPKGSRKIGETDWEAAERETWEEAGIDISTLLYKGKRKLKYGTYFLLQLKTRYHTCTPKETQTALACWMSKKELRDQAAVNNFDLNLFCKK